MRKRIYSDCAPKSRREEEETFNPSGIGTKIVCGFRKLKIFDWRPKLVETSTLLEPFKSEMKLVMGKGNSSGF